MRKKNNILKFLTMLLTLILMIISVNAIDFKVNTTNIVKTLNTSQDSIDYFTITNNGSSNISLNITTNNLISGNNSINLTINQTSIINLTPGNSTGISVNYNTGNFTGIYTGSLFILDSSNFSKNISVNFNINVTSENLNNESNSTSENSNSDSNDSGIVHSIKFDGYDSTLTMNINVDDSREKKTFHLINDGNVTIYDIKIDLDTRFDGDDDEIYDDDFEINGEDGQDTFDKDDDSDLSELKPGEIYNVDLDLDIPSNLDVDDYKGDIDVSYEYNGTRYTKTFTLKIIAESDNEDVKFTDHSLYVKNGILKVFAEPGEYLTDPYLTIYNSASYDIEGLTLRIDDDFKEEDSSNIMSKSVVEFEKEDFTVYDRDSEDIDLKITIPDDQPTGVYSTDVKLISKTGKELDKMTLQIEVIGDIYIASIDYKDSTVPNSYVDVTVDVHNKGSILQRNVKIYGTLFDIDSSNSDIYESSSAFLLDANSNRKEVLRFKIPEDATDGSHILEIKVNYGGNIITKIENLDIIRPAHKIKVESYAINPRVSKCDKLLYTYIKYQNLGKYDEDTTVKTEIKGTGISESTNEVELSVDEIAQKSLSLDISQLKPGTYDVIQTIEYGSNLKETRESTLRIDKCGGSSLGLEIKNQSLNNSELNSNNNSDNKVEIFGKKIEKTTAYLGGGVGIVSMLIILLLFLI